MLFRSIGPSKTTLGYNTLKIACDCLTDATLPLSTEQAKLEGLGHARNILQGMYNNVPSVKLLTALKAVSQALDKKEAPFNARKLKADGSLKDAVAHAQIQQENSLELACITIATFGCGLGVHVRNLEHDDGSRTQPQNRCRRNCFQVAAAIPPLQIGRAHV